MEWQASASAEQDTERDSRSSEAEIAISHAGAGAWTRPVIRRFSLDRTLSSPVSSPYIP